ncbi:MAG: MOSC domain-containing protein [Anaerolineae bacterium]
MPGTLLAVCSSDNRWQPKHDVREGVLCAGHGLLGDSHAGISDREISLLMVDSLRRAEAELGKPIPPGSFAENLVVEGIALDALAVGDLLTVGPTILEIVQLGKPLGTPHTYAYQGMSLLPSEGVFCHILQGGPVIVGDLVSHRPGRRGR